MKGISEKENHNNKIEQTFKDRSQEIMPEIKRILNLCLAEKSPHSPQKKEKGKLKQKLTISLGKTVQNTKQKDNILVKSLDFTYKERNL